MIEERNKVLAVDLLQRALLAVVHHSEVLVVIREVVQGKWSTQTQTHRQTDRQTNRQIYTHTHTHTHTLILL